MSTAGPATPPRPSAPAGAPDADQPAGKSGKQHSFARDAIEVLLIAVVLYIVISLNFQTVRVEGASMVPTLQNQDWLLASRISYRLHDPERGDIIVLQPPTDPEKDFIKRVMGIPGDRIEINPLLDKAGADVGTTVLLQVGGSGPWERVAEAYLNERWTDNNSCCRSNPGSTDLLLPPSSKPQPFVIPEKQYFVMGDNRNHSQDSRSIGLIPRDNILAKAFVRMYPLGAFGSLGGGPVLIPQLGLLVPLGSRRGRRELRRRLAWGSLRN